MSGRPSKFKPEYIEQAARLAVFGLTDKQMADFFEVAEQTFNSWKNAHPGLQESLKGGKETYDAQVEMALCKRALGYEKDDRHYPPDVTACIFWLKNRKPDEWRDVKERHVKHQETETDMLDLAKRLAYVLSEGADQIKTIN